MPSDKISGRTAEQRLLCEAYDSLGSEFVAVYGRRRVGKTFLILETLRDRLDFVFSGMFGVNSKIALRAFHKELTRQGAGPLPVPTDWFTAFDQLKDHLLSLNKSRVAVFLDELPWMDTPKSYFLQALSSFWNMWNNSDVMLKLYVCGSATSWMVDRLIGDRGGLYGRLTRPIYLAPFTLGETEKYINETKQLNYGRRQILDAYMVFGGIPYYLNLLDRKLPLAANIDAIIFADKAPLRTEFEFLFRSLFRESNAYRRIIELLATKLKGLTREELARDSGISGGELTKILQNLNNCDFIRYYMSPQKKKRGKIYQLTDMFSLFHLRFASAANDGHFWTNLGKTGRRNAWAGYAFEQTCLHHIQQIKMKLGITGVLTNAYAWSSKACTDQDGRTLPGGQIDLILDRNDGIMNLCEMKYAQGEYEISAELEEQLRNRADLLRTREKTRKDLRNTFITLYGVKQGLHSGIVDDEITLDDLFT